jgi:hypothetical protein
MKLDNEKILHLASDLRFGINNDGYLKTSAIIGCFEDVTYELVAYSKRLAKMEKKTLDKKFECLTNA